MKKNKTVLIISGTLAVILLLAASIGFFYKPKTVFLGKVNKFYKQTSNELLTALKDNEYNKLSSNQTMQTKGKVSWQIASPALESFGPEYKTMLDEINKSSLNYDVIIDKTNQKLQANIDFNYNNALFQNIKGSIEDEAGYIYLTDIYEEYIKFPVDNSEEIFKNDKTIEDAMYVGEFIVKNYVKNIPDEAFNQKSATIKVDGEELKTRQLIYEETPKAMAQNMIEVIKLMKEDTEVQKRLMNLMGYESKSKLNKALDERIDILAEEDETNKTLVISIYVKGITNEFVRLTIGEKDASSNLVITKLKTTSYQIDILEDDKPTVVINIKKENEVYNYKINLLESNYIITGIVKKTHQEVVASKKYRDTLLFTINIKDDGNNLFNADINAEMEVNFGVRFTDVDLNDSIEYDKLTEEDKSFIYQNLTNKMSKIDVSSL